MVRFSLLDLEQRLSRSCRFCQECGSGFCNHLKACDLSAVSLHPTGVSNSLAVLPSKLLSSFEKKSEKMERSKPFIFAGACQLLLLAGPGKRFALVAALRRTKQGFPILRGRTFERARQIKSNQQPSATSPRRIGKPC